MKRTPLILMLCIGFAGGTAGYKYYHDRKAADQESHVEIRLPDAYTREAWLNLHGFAVTAVSEEECRMPFQYRTAAGNEWLLIQQSQGLSPELHGGETGVRYRYHIENLCADTFYAELIVCSEVLAGAVIYDASTQKMERVR